MVMTSFPPRLQVDYACAARAHTGGTVPRLRASLKLPRFRGEEEVTSFISFRCASSACGLNTEATFRLPVGAFQPKFIFYGGEMTAVALPDGLDGLQSQLGESSGYPV